MVDLKNLTRHMLVFNLPHEQYCVGEGASGCACTVQTVVVMEAHPATGDKWPKKDVKRVSGSLTVLPRSWARELPDSVLKVPEVKSALANGSVTVVKLDEKVLDPKPPATEPAVEGKPSKRR